MRKQLLLFMVLLSACMVGFPQNSPSKFGKVSMDELANKVCPIDSNAHAYFIFNCGLSHFTYPQTVTREDDATESKGFILETSRHFRIKILDETAFDWANVEIPLYVLGNDKEKIVSFKACTYNLENGKMEKTNFSKGNLIYEKTSDRWETAKAPLPNVKKGSIIEVSYTIVSDFYFNLDKWLFQYSIPVLYSNYEVRIPEYFMYHTNIVGYYPVQVINSHKYESLTLTYIRGQLNGGDRITNTFNYEVGYNEYESTNIPAFMEDSYLKSSKNYLTAVEFELSATKFPNSPMKSYSNTWEDVINQFLSNSEFGTRVKRTGFLDDVVQQISNKAESQLEKMNMAFRHVANRYKWNEKSSVVTSKSLNNSYREGFGNSADINLCLVGLLQSMDIEAYPMLLSTQSNGFVKLTHPSISNFNYVIALAKIDRKTYLLDATEPLTVVNQLPVRCLNDKGLVVKSSPVEWIDLTLNTNYKSQVTLEYELAEDLQITGRYLSTLEGYAALEQRKEIISYGSQNDYIQSVSKNIPGIEINQFEIGGMDTLEHPVHLAFDFNYPNQVEEAGDLIIFKPLLFQAIKRSPFKLKERIYPVEYNYHTADLVICQIKIPHGYSIESLPPSINMSLPDKSARYVYTVMENNGKIVITAFFTRNKLTYLPKEYGDLKEFYRMMVDKQNEKIVFKKI